MSADDRKNTPHWRAYREMVNDHSDLVESLEEAILDYAEPRDEVTGAEAKQAVLKNWQHLAEWKAILGKLSDAVFAVVLYQTLNNDDWEKDQKSAGPYKAMVYTRRW